MTNLIHVPKKRFGQNFLCDQNIIEQIINVIAPKTTEHFVEIGPGKGALTLQLLPKVKKLDAIELDRDLIPILVKSCANFHNLILHQADVLQFDFATLPDLPLRVVGNLPYNISTPVLFYLADYNELVTDLHFMLQLEVAERMIAKPNSKAYGRLSVMLQYYYNIDLLFHVPASSFSPIPKVTSAFVRLRPQTAKKIAVKDLNLFADLVRAAFNHRRKTIKNSLQEFISGEELSALGISPLCRAEQLTVDNYVQICNSINIINKL